MKYLYHNKLIRSLYFLYKSYSKRSNWKGNQKIFCLSMQKTGTTSFGDFFAHFDYPVVRSNLAQLRNWNAYWYYGIYRLIFMDPVFRNHQVFEDAPFWAKDFYQVLQSKFPEAKYVLMTRESNSWFDSLLNHGNGEIIGNKKFHAKNYEIPEAYEGTNFQLSDHRNYYTKFYEKRNQEVINFFQDKNSPFLHLELEDPEKWKKLADFVNLTIPHNFEMHSNKKDIYLNKHNKLNI